MPDPFNIGVISISTIVGLVLGLFILLHPSHRRRHICWFTLSLLFAVFLQVLVVLILEIHAIGSLEHGSWACHAGIFLDRLTIAILPLLIACITLDRLLTMKKHHYQTDQRANGMSPSLFTAVLLISWILAIGVACVFTYALNNPSRGTLPLTDCHFIWAQILGRQEADFALRVVAPFAINTPLVLRVLVVYCQQKRKHGFSATRSILLILFLNLAFDMLVWPLPIYLLVLYVTGETHNFETLTYLVDVHRSVYAVLPLILLFYFVCDLGRSKDLYISDHEQSSNTSRPLMVKVVSKPQITEAKQTGQETLPNPAPMDRANSKSSELPHSDHGPDDFPGKITQEESMDPFNQDQFATIMNELQKLKKLEAIEKQITSLSSSVTDVQNSLGATKKDVSNLKKEIDILKKRKEQPTIEITHCGKDEFEDIDTRNIEAGQLATVIDGLQDEAEHLKKGLLNVI